jgi:DNA-binding NtrC family response regulator
MPDPMMLANNRPSRFVPPTSAAIELVGRSAAVARAQELVRRAAALDTGVLIVAERGSDAESVARELHARSRSAVAPWILLECAGGDAGAIDHVLFGRLPDFAPTDLESVAPDSRLAAARGGTIFLQDVGELPSSVQARLARIARDGEVRIDGAPVATDVRFIASALPTIDAEVRENRFRADLYRRLAASRIDLPALRDRPDDVPALAKRLLEGVAAPEENVDGADSTDGHRPSFTHAALALLAALSWPGNLAELRAVVERAAAERRDGTIQVEHVLPALKLERAQAPFASFAPAGNLREARLRFERDYIAAVLQHHGWRMAEAANTLGIQRPNLYRKARQLGIPVARLTE